MVSISVNHYLSRLGRLKRRAEREKTTSLEERVISFYETDFNDVLLDPKLTSVEGIQRLKNLLEALSKTFDSSFCIKIYQLLGSIENKNIYNITQRKGIHSGWDYGLLKHSLGPAGYTLLSLEKIAEELENFRKQKIKNLSQT